MLDLTASIAAHWYAAVSDDMAWCAVAVLVRSRNGCADPPNDEVGGPLVAPARRRAPVPVSPNDGNDANVEEPDNDGSRSE